MSFRECSLITYVRLFTWCFHVRLHLCNANIELQKFYKVLFALKTYFPISANFVKPHNLKYTVTCFVKKCCFEIQKARRWYFIRHFKQMRLTSNINNNNFICILLTAQIFYWTFLLRGGKLGNLDCWSVIPNNFVTIATCSHAIDQTDMQTTETFLDRY